MQIGESINTDLAAIFTDPDGGDYTLKTDSPAIDAGYDLPAYFTTDILGATPTGTWDIGAYEYGGSPPGGGTATATSATAGTVNIAP